MVHPDYDDDTTDNDFMLLFLKRSTTEDVDLAIVNPDMISEGQNVTVMGDGVISIQIKMKVNLQMNLWRWK